MPRAVKPASEAIGEAPAQEPPPVAGLNEGTPTEATPEAPASEPAKPETLLKVQVNCHQRITVKSKEHTLLIGTHEITDPGLAAEIKNIVESGAKRQLFIL